MASGSSFVFLCLWISRGCFSLNPLPPQILITITSVMSLGLGIALGLGSSSSYFDFKLISARFRFGGFDSEMHIGSGNPSRYLNYIHLDCILHLPGAVYGNKFYWSPGRFTSNSPGLPVIWRQGRKSQVLAGRQQVLMHGPPKIDGALFA